MRAGAISPSVSARKYSDAWVSNEKARAVLLCGLVGVSTACRATEQRSPSDATSSGSGLAKQPTAQPSGERANSPLANQEAASDSEQRLEVPLLPTLPPAPAPELQVFRPVANPRSDEAPWAAAFINHTTQKAGIESAESERACDWLKWGQPFEKPSLGSVAIFDFGQGACRGHIGMVVGKCGNALVVLGGNQQNAVKRLAFANDHIAGFRVPPGITPFPLDFDLPEVVPEGVASCKDLHATHETSTLARLPSRSICTVQGPGVAQVMEVTRTSERQVRFRAASSGSCSRELVGEAFEIFFGDVEIDAEAGLAYPAEEYHYWGDEAATTGATVRLSLEGKLRARIVEWGPGNVCRLSDAIMHCEAASDP
jgi:uncharacterized protein (TIGR02594 family)